MCQPFRLDGVENPRWLDVDEDRAWRGWLAMAELLRSQVAHDLLADSGLSDSDYLVLVQLSESEGRRVRMNDLAARLNWSKSRLSHQLARMQARGLVEREECPSDARGAFAVLSPGGLAEIERAAPKHVESVRRHLIDILDREQLAQLSAISERIVGHLSTESACTEALAAAGGACDTAGPADGCGLTGPAS
jgi:DNA-binding MarR family transcriptional regulator